MVLSYLQNNRLKICAFKNNKMKKLILIIPCLICFNHLLLAQSKYSPATENQQKELTQKITAASNQMKTLQCDFLQKKTISILADEMNSEGRMLYKQNDKLQWEYTKPYQYKFTMNGDKVMIHSGKNKNIIDVKSSKIFKEISKIIVSGINGSGIFEQDKFTSSFWVGTADYKVALKPKQKELKQLFSNITLYFNKNDYTVNTVEIEESNGDKTTIQMKNKQLNKELKDEIFTIQ